MNEENKRDLLFFTWMFTLVVALFFGFSSGIKQGEKNSKIQFELDAIKHGHAIYNPTNGVWQWK